jgi:hypothetical protein
MPKESVYGINAPFAESIYAAVPGKSIVEVSWARDQQVQIASKAVRSLDGGRLVKDDEGVHYTDGFYVDLDRKGINDLIRNLRRARDQAFGRDE